MLATTMACRANPITTTSSLCSFSHLQCQPFPSLSCCRKQYIVLNLPCPLGQVLRYPEKPFYASVRTRVAENEGLLVLTSSHGLILRVFVFSASAGNSTSMNQKLPQEKSSWDLKRIRKYFLCFLLPFLPCLLPKSGWIWCVSLPSYFKPSLETAFIATYCYLVAKLQIFGGGSEGLPNTLPDATAFIHWTSLLWQQNLWPHKYSFPLNSQNKYKEYI